MEYKMEKHLRFPTCYTENLRRDLWNKKIKVKKNMQLVVLTDSGAKVRW